MRSSKARRSPATHLSTSCSSDGPPSSLAEPAPAAVSSTCFALASIDKTAKLSARLENHQGIVGATWAGKNGHKAFRRLSFREAPERTFPPPPPSFPPPHSPAP